MLPYPFGHRFWFYVAAWQFACDILAEKQVKIADAFCIGTIICTLGRQWYNGYGGILMVRVKGIRIGHTLCFGSCVLFIYNAVADHPRSFAFQVGNKKAGTIGNYAAGISLGWHITCNGSNILAKGGICRAEFYNRNGIV